MCVRMSVIRLSRFSRVCAARHSVSKGKVFMLSLSKRIILAGVFVFSGLLVSIPIRCETLEGASDRFKVALQYESLIAQKAIHFDITVTEAESGQPRGKGSAELIVRQGNDGPKAIPAEQGKTPGTYHADVRFADPGEWTISLYLSGDGKSATISFPSVVVADNPNPSPATPDDHGHDHGDDAHAHDHELEAGVIEVSDEMQKALGISTAKLERRDLAITRDLNGWIKPRPQNKSEVHAPAEGTVREIFAWPGEFVESGQPLVSLKISSSLEWQETLVSSGKEVASLERTIGILKDEGNADVIRLLGEILVSSGEAANLRRELELLESAGASAVSRQDVYSKQGELKSAETNLKARRGAALSFGIEPSVLAAIEADGELPTQSNGFLPPAIRRQIEEMSKAIAEAKIRKQTAQARLKSLGFPAQSLERLMNGDPTAITDTVVLRAELPGLILESTVFAQRVVSPNDLLFRVIDYRDIQVQTEVPEVDIERIIGRASDRVQVRILGMGDHVVEATVAYLDTEVHTGERMAHLVVDLPNIEGMPLREGMAVTVAIPIEERKQILALPPDAVRYDGLEQVVFVREGDHFHRHPVVTGIQGFDWIEILSGIGEGDEIAVEGVYPLYLALHQDEAGAGAHAGHSH